MSEEAGEAGGLSAGERLLNARQRSGMSLIQAADRLHLDATTLQALEGGHFEALGAAVFVRGHLRRYAELLGLPPAEIEAAYAASSNRVAPQPDLRRVATPLDGSNTHGVTLGPHTALIGAVVVVLFALVWWAMRVPSASRPAPSSRATSRLAAAPPTSKAISADAATTGGATDTTAASASVAERSSSHPVPAPVAAALPVRPVAVAATQPASALAHEAAATPAVTPTAVRLGVRFSQDSWAEIYDANGTRLFYDVGAAGSQRHLSGAPPLRVVLGNPAGVSLALDGRAVSLGAAAERGNPIHFSLDAGGHISEARAVDGVPSPPPPRP